MLKKLIKYDFKDSGRVIFPILLGILALSVLGRILLETKLYYAVPEALQFLSAGMFILILVVCCVGAPVYFAVNFYKHFYGKRGYLTHTLPTTSGQKIFSRVFTAYILELLIYLTCIVALFIIFYSDKVADAFNQYMPLIDSQFETLIGMSLSAFFGATGALMLVSLITELLILLTCVSIGQLLKKHRVLGTIGTYLGIYFVNQFLSTLLLVAIGFDMTADISAFGDSYVYTTYLLSAGLSLLECVLFSFLSRFIMEKKLNLN